MHLPTANPDRYVFPEWPAPANVHAVVTTRQCGNMALHVNDDPFAVAANRKQLQQDLGLLALQPVWLDQVHGVDAINLDCAYPSLTGDASYTRTREAVSAILTADCLPLLFSSHHGNEVAAAHAGWRGLLAGIIDTTLHALQTPAPDLLVWLGPAIGPDHFEVGVEVREKFISRHPDYAEGFRQAKNGAWFGDLYQLAKINLHHCGISAIYGGGFCTFCDSRRFYSYRREQGITGRMASLIWFN